METSTDQHASLETTTVEAPVLSPRIHSMDQFRGFIVAAMFVVNFEAALTEFRMFRHDGGYSFADMIMPGFIFAVGYSFRLTALRKYPAVGFSRLAGETARRSLLLILIVLVMQGFGFRTWEKWDSFNKLPRNYVPAADAEAAADDVNAADDAKAEEDDSRLPDFFWMNWGYWILGIFRRRLCDVLGIIALTQLIVLPVILTSWRIRVLAMLIFGITHMLLTHWFNWNFFYSRPNIVDGWLHLRPRASYDGGFFGNVSWAVVMLAGSLAYDIVAASTSRLVAARRLAICGLALMCAGYVLSMPSRIYDLQSTTDAERREEIKRLEAHPVFPPVEWMKGRALRDWLPPVPVFQKVEDLNCAGNYWLVLKSLVTLPFVVFSSGFLFALYSLFVVFTDRLGWQVGVFRTLGTNALTAYVIHDYVGKAMQGAAPSGAPDWYRYAALAAYFLVVYAFIRTLEAKRIYIRL